MVEPDPPQHCAKFFIPPPSFLPCSDGVLVVLLRRPTASIFFFSFLMQVFFKYSLFSNPLKASFCCNFLVWFNFWGWGLCELVCKGSSVTCPIIRMILEDCEMPISNLVLQLMFMWPVF